MCECVGRIVDKRRPKQNDMDGIILVTTRHQFGMIDAHARQWASCGVGVPAFRGSLAIRQPYSFEQP